jgi:hypothetical protein
LLYFPYIQCRKGKRQQKEIYTCAEILVDEVAQREHVYEQVMQMRLSINPLRIVRHHTLLSLLGPGGLTLAVNQFLRWEGKSIITSRLADNFCSRIENITSKSGNKFINNDVPFHPYIYTFSFVFILVMSFLTFDYRGSVDIIKQSAISRDELSFYPLTSLPFSAVNNFFTAPSSKRGLRMSELVKVEGGDNISISYDDEGNSHVYIKKAVDANQVILAVDGLFLSKLDNEQCKTKFETSPFKIDNQHFVDPSIIHILHKQQGN